MKIFENLDSNDLSGEIWKEIEGYDEDYFISNLGRIKSFKKCRGINEKILIPNKDNGGYYVVSLSKNGKEKTKGIHVLMYETFNNYKLKKNECIHHIDFTKNNILENFQLTTRGDHSVLHNKNKTTSEETKELMSDQKKGEHNPNVKLKEQDVIQIRIILDEGILIQAEIAKMFGVSVMTISYIKLRKTWKYIR